MIIVDKIKHKGLKQLVEDGKIERLSTAHIVALREAITALDVAAGPQDLTNPRFRLHPMKGDRQGEWSLWIDHHWRLTFKFKGRDVIGLNLEDYH